MRLLCLAIYVVAFIMAEIKAVNNAKNLPFCTLLFRLLGLFALPLTDTMRRFLDVILTYLFVFVYHRASVFNGEFINPCTKSSQVKNNPPRSRDLRFNLFFVRLANSLLNV